MPPLLLLERWSGQTKAYLGVCNLPSFSVTLECLTDMQKMLNFWADKCTQLISTYLKSTIETLEKGIFIVNYLATLIR